MHGPVGFAVLGMGRCTDGGKGYVNSKGCERFQRGNIISAILWDM